jgi:polysaccharide deacetylase family protein (PEP-CTERM system associated)
MYILTFDIEEWFHILDNESTKTINEWKNYEVRIHTNMERIFSILDKRNQKATFFCLGWIAETYPEIIKEIIARGYEIGTHTSRHQLIYEQTPAAFAKDLERSVKTLEDLTGHKVKYFRAPGFSIREDNKWAFEIMASQGIEIDCSVFPAARSHGGFPSYKEPVPSILKYRGIELKEFPINYKTILGKPIIFSGGGYFRLSPYPLIKQWTNQSNYVMTYMHPRDFDADQPFIKELSLLRRFKSYVGLKGATGKLEKWITDFEFIDLGTAVKTIDWEEVPIVEL